MYCLFLDTSSATAVLALFEDGNVLEEVALEVKSARHPCVVWQSMLDRHHLTLQEIDFLACGVGPGSYTGLRTAAATVKGVVLATAKPIVAVSSLLTLVPEGLGRYFLMIDGGISGAYTQRVSVSETSVEPDAPQSIPSNELENVMAKETSLITDSMGWLEKKGLKTSSIQTERRHASIVARYVFQEAKSGRVYTAQTLPLWYTHVSPA